MTLFWLLKGCLKIYVAKMSCRKMFMHNIRDQKLHIFDIQNHYFKKNLLPIFSLMSTVIPVPVGKETLTVFPALYVIHLWIFMTIDTSPVCISPRKNWDTTSLIPTCHNMQQLTVIPYHRYTPKHPQLQSDNTPTLYTTTAE